MYVASYGDLSWVYPIQMIWKEVVAAYSKVECIQGLALSGKE